MIKLYPSLRINLDPEEKEFIKNKKVILAIDFQSYSRGKYAKEVDINAYPIKSIIWHNLIYFLKQIVNLSLQLEKEYFSELYSVIIFSDEGRNLFNEALIPEWKANRRKHLAYLAEKNSELFFTSQILENANKIVFKLLQEISKYTKIETIFLKHMDSDFYPAFYRILQKNEDYFYILITKDKDFYHLVNSSTYIFLDKIYGPKTLMESLSEKHNINSKKQVLYLYYFYPLIHALSGDRSDNIEPLIKHRGVKHWLKILAEEFHIDFPNLENLNFENHPKWELYNIILQNNFLFKSENPSMKEELTNKLLKRLILLDFDLHSLIILRVAHREIYEKYNFDEKIKNLVEFCLSKFINNSLYKNILFNIYIPNSHKEDISEFKKFIEKFSENFKEQLNIENLELFYKKLAY